MRGTGHRDPMGASSHSNIGRVVVIVQENHTTDNYFRGLAPLGVNVATDWPTQANPPVKDQPHDRRAYGAWLKGTGRATRTQFDTACCCPTTPGWR